jgi:hypothetical protein
MAATNLNPAPPLSSLATTNDIRDIKPLVEIPNAWAWLWWTLGLLVLAALAFWAWRYWRKQQTHPIASPVNPPHVRAKQKLAEALAWIHDPKPFCIAVSDAIRTYLEERFKYRAPERTTEEFLLELTSATALYPDQKQSLGDFLQSCDLVKFARYEPTEAALKELHDSALRLVDETQFDPVDTMAPAVEGKA